MAREHMSGSDLEMIRRQLGGRYTIERELGRGGMGTVYLARDVRLDRPVALKVLPAAFALDAALRERFLRETRTAASFSHPNIVPVHAIEESDELLAFAMGYVEGDVLTERVKRVGPLDTRELVRLLQDIGYALAYAHGRGVVHRDIKPDNVMIERATGRALLMDFGISRTITQAPTGVAGLTRVGEVVGSPSYMSPEQAAADTLDGRSDLYSLGLVAFFAATGRTAMSGSTPQRILVRQLTEAVPPLADERRDLPQLLTDAIDRCVAKDPAARFANAEALVEAIDAMQLAAPEIPIPIRGFVQELGTLMLIVVVMIGFSWQVVRTAPTDLPEALRLMPVAFFFGVALTRLLQALSVVRRLAEAGFSASDIMRGLRATVDEQDSLREQIKRNPGSHARRRKTIILALLQLPLAALLFYVAARLNAPPAGAVQPAAGIRPGPPLPLAVGSTPMMVLGQLFVASSLVLLSRSPFRVPIGERVFRLVWLGPIGRAFVRFGARSVASTADRNAVLTATPVAYTLPAAEPRAASVAALPTPSTLSTLDARITALERWRDELQ